MPSSTVSRCSSTAPRISSRAYRTLPALESTTLRITDCSTGPSSTLPTSCSIASSLSGLRFIRSAPASFQSASIASGVGSPTQIVAITKAPAAVARCSSSAAEAGSSRCASSTATTTPRPWARSRSLSVLRRINSRGSTERTSSGIRAANAPSGTVAELRVPRVQYTRSPSDSAAASASRATRDRPNPTPLAITTPGQSASRRADAIRSSSTDRPVNGQSRARCEMGAGPGVNPPTSPRLWPRTRRCEPASTAGTARPVSHGRRGV